MNCERNETNGIGVYVVCWVDHAGNPVTTVADRFQSLYMFADDESGEAAINNKTLGEQGLYSLLPQDARKLGFSDEEFEVLLAYENEHGVPVQSEDELMEIMRSGAWKP